MRDAHLSGLGMGKVDTPASRLEGSSRSRGAPSTTSNYTEARSVSLRRMKLAWRACTDSTRQKLGLPKPGRNWYESDSKRRSSSPKHRTVSTRNGTGATPSCLVQSCNEGILGKAHWIILQIGWRKLLCGTPSIICPCLRTNATRHCRSFLLDVHLSSCEQTMQLQQRGSPCSWRGRLDYRSSTSQSSPMGPRLSTGDFGRCFNMCSTTFSDHDRRKEVSLSMLVRPREGVPHHIPFREHGQAVHPNVGCPGQTIRAHGRPDG